MNIISDKDFDINDDGNFGVRYTPLEIINNGAYSTVIKALDNNTTEFVAIKVINDGLLLRYYYL